VIHLEEEPWSLAALELSWLSTLMRVPLAFFSWENLDNALALPFRLIRRRVLRVTRGAVTGNTEGLTLLEGQGFTGNTAVLPQLGIDTAAFRPATSRPTGVVGYVGRLVPQKGINILLQAMVRIAEPCRLMIVGRGPMKDELIRQARDLGLNGRFELHEDVGHGEVPAYMARMSILVLPSLTTPIWKEQFGHVLVEAMASGLPVIGSDSGAIPEVIGKAGLVVREGDVEALAVAIERLLSDSTLHAQLATLGRERVDSNYTNEVVAQRLSSFLDRIVNGES
jgi:glycosyltransferase involved in cell wall biosynthesis